MSNKIINITAKASFFIQIVTGAIDIYVLRYDLDEKNNILRQLLILELIVQIVEGTFYFWLINSFDKIKNITSYRYYDWAISTPTMLLTLIVYLIYLKNIEESKSDPNSNSNSVVLDLFQIVEDNKKIIIQILLLNELMLYFGYLGETNKLTSKQSFILGIIPFLIYYKMIYDNFAKYTEVGKKIYNYFFFVWLLYGFASLGTYEIKNTIYNILDLFAKNFFGLYLSYLIYKNKK